MSIKQNELIKSLIRGLKIQNDVFAIEAVREAIQPIEEADYLEFYKEVMQENTYGNGMKAILQTAKRYTPLDKNLLQLESAYEKAKEMYSKFYELNAALTDYTLINRKTVKNDREFFKNIDYSKLLTKDNERVFTKQEIYVLNELGGGEWLLEIKYQQYASDIIKKIEAIIKKAVTEKYIKSNAIKSKQVLKQLTGIRRAV